MFENKEPVFAQFFGSPAIIRDMTERWFISDTHFFHEKLLNFEKEDGHKCRSQFSSVEEMNEIMIERWNARVKPGDRVRHLGDVILGLKGDEWDTKGDRLLSRLNGRKDLILGNHDNPKRKVLQNHFRRIDYWKTYRRKEKEWALCLTHVPHRLDQIRKTDINIHGHIHEKVMEEHNYICVCVEQTNYAPVHLDEILTLCRQRNLI